MNRNFKERFAQLEVQANTFHADAIGGLNIFSSPPASIY